MRGKGVVLICTLVGIGAVVAAGAASSGFGSQSSVRSFAHLAKRMGPNTTGTQATKKAQLRGVNFVSGCRFSHRNTDDPIVYPGQPGKSHLHQFYGNTSADGNSTYSSLRSNGSSTCMSPLNRSAYWMPAMLDGKGNVVRPDHVTIYYKRRPASDPKCSLTSGDPAAEGNCVPLPNGLRFVFGYDMVTGTPPTGQTYFNCAGPTAVAGHYPDLPTALANCPAGEGNRVGAVIKAPACWDGKNLDSPNHRDHVAYAAYYNGVYKCPSTHTYVIPGFTLQAWWGVAAEDNPKLWSLSSDAMRPDLPAGSTFHADWFGAWDNIIMGMWMDNCINKLLNCSAGDLGNGKMMKQFAGFSWTANPRLVPVPQ